MRTPRPVPALTSILEEGRHSNADALTSTTVDLNAMLAVQCGGSEADGSAAGLRLVERREEVSQPEGRTETDEGGRDVILQLEPLITTRSYMSSYCKHSARRGQLGHWKRQVHFCGYCSNCSNYSISSGNCIMYKKKMCRMHRYCPLCNSRFHQSSSSLHPTVPSFALSQRRRPKSLLSVSNVVHSIFIAGRRFYSVWTSVLVVWVLALVLICDLQSYSSRSTSSSSATTLALSSALSAAVNESFSKLDDNNRSSSSAVLHEFTLRNTDQQNAQPQLEKRGITRLDASSVSTSSIHASPIPAGLISAAITSEGRTPKGLTDDRLAPAVSSHPDVAADGLRVLVSSHDTGLAAEDTHTSVQAVINQNMESVTAGLHVEVYYEPLCPDSRHFVHHQLSPAIDLLSDAVDLQMVPYGKAMTHEEAGKLSFQCQHGPTECLANKIHGCVVYEVKEQRKQVKIIDCMITDNYKPKAAGEKCVTDHAGPKVWASVQQCYTSKKGDQILKHMGTMTHSLEPSVSFIPTITINKSQDDQNRIMQDFTKALCKRFKIGIPDACVSHRS